MILWVEDGLTPEKPVMEWLAEVDTRRAQDAASA